MSSTSTPTPGTQRRWAQRRSAAPLAKIGMVLFAIGLLAIFADLVLFAIGTTDLPLWLNLVCLLAPVGLGVGLVGVVRETRRASPVLVARAEAAAAETVAKKGRQKVSAEPARGEKPEHSEEWNQPT